MNGPDTLRHRAAPPERDQVRAIAVALSLVWLSWWVFIGLASGLGQGLSPIGLLLHATLPGLIFSISVLAAWRWELIGACGLLLEGLLVLLIYPMLTYTQFSLSTVLLVTLTMAFPPLLTGSLFLDDWRRSTR